MHALRMAFALAALLLGTAVSAQPRVVTLAPHLGELVCAVGACAQLVGVVRHSDFPAELRQRPQVGDAFSVNAEAVLALRPDLVLAWDSGTPAAIVTRLRSLGLRVETVRVRSLDDVGLALLRVGALLGHEDTACQVEAAYAQRIATLRERYRHAAPITAMYQIEPEPVFTINARSPISEAFAVCGARNVFATLDRLAAPVSREAVLAADPEAIVFGRQDDVAGIRRGWQRFPQLRALRAHNLIAVDADALARATPRMAQGIESLCAALDAARARRDALKP